MMLALTDADDDAEVIFLTASGSGAMEAAVMNSFDEKGQASHYFRRDFWGAV